MLSSLTRRTGALLALLAVLVLAVLGVATAGPAAAEEQVVRITGEGVVPAVLTVAPGDTVRFVNETMALGVRAVSTSDNWSFDSRLALFPGRSYTVPDALTEPGTYTYRVADGERFAGSVVVPAPAPAPAAAPSPAGSPAAAPAPAEPGAAPAPAPGAPGAPGAPPASPAPGTPAAPGSTGGTGAAALPPLTGAGFGAVGLLPAPEAPAAGPAPDVAPPPPPGQAPVLAVPQPPAATVPLTAPAVPGALPGGDTARELGLPAVIAALLAVGTASLLVRLLLAEPAARRRFPLAGPDPLATVD